MPGSTVSAPSASGLSVIGKGTRQANSCDQNNSNCLVLHPFEKDSNFNSRSIFEGIAPVVKANQITAISKHGNSHKWVIQLNNASKAADFWGGSVCISGKHHAILSTEALLDKTPNATKVIRLHGLPLNFNGNLLKDWVQNYVGLKWIGFTLEHFREADMRHIHNGVLRIKVSLSDEPAALISISKIQGNKTVYIGSNKINFLVTVAGEQAKCYGCQQLGHVRARCPRNLLKCSKCKHSGHLAEECKSDTFAGKLAQSIDDATNNEADELEEEGIESGGINTFSDNMPFQPSARPESVALQLPQQQQHEQNATTPAKTTTTTTTTTAEATPSTTTTTSTPTTTIANNQSQHSKTNKKTNESKKKQNKESAEIVDQTLSETLNDIQSTPNMPPPLTTVINAESASSSIANKSRSRSRSSSSTKRKPSSPLSETNQAKLQHQ